MLHSCKLINGAVSLGVEWVPLVLPVGEKPHAGWIERLAYKTMDNVLNAGWTPELAAHIYGGISESKMRSMVAYARQQGS